ncbi:hypothetical protein ACP4OV_021035 [Aristida adscensionis]
MGRKKVNLQWITHDSTRRSVFRRRCKGLMKKAGDLVTLCGVKVCVVVYGEGEAQPEVWPSVPEATSLLTHFRAMPDHGTWKKTTTQEELLDKRIDALQGQVTKLADAASEAETALLLHDAVTGRRQGLAGVGVQEMASLERMVELKLRRAEELIQKRLQQMLQTPPASPAPSLQPPQVPYNYDTGSTQHLVHGEGALPEPEPMLPPPASGSAVLPPVAYAAAEMHGLAPVEDWIVDMGQDGGELVGAVLPGAFVGGSGDAGPSGVVGDDAMRSFDLSSPMFPCSPWDPFAPME